jgi:Kazal-type serine protease inhibitor domain
MRLHFGRLVAALMVVSGIASGSAWAAASASNSANLDEPCGGPNHITCNSALYCQLPAGQCSAADVPGVCAKAPDFCMRVSRPVCGCNGKTYPNECEARHAKMAIDTTGACKKPPADGTVAPKPAAKKKKKPAKPPAKPAA